MLYCGRCNGRVFLDRMSNKSGHIELSCIRCGWRCEAHRNSEEAKIFNKIERRRELGHLGPYHTKNVLSQ